jgi:hypothetical protein
MGGGQPPTGYTYLGEERELEGTIHTSPNVQFFWLSVLVLFYGDNMLGCDLYQPRSRSDYPESGEFLLFLGRPITSRVAPRHRGRKPADFLE